MKRSDEWAEAMAVECPRCLAAVGEPCLTASGDVVTNGPHTGRMFAARGQPVEERWKAQPPKPPKAPSKLAQEMALADALYAVLDECFNEEGMFIFEEDSFIDSVVEAKARYRKERGR